MKEPEFILSLQRLLNLNEKLLKIIHAFTLVRDCIEQLGQSKCDYMSTIDL